MIRFEHRGFTFYATKYKIHPGFPGNREEPPEDPEVEVSELAIGVGGDNYEILSNAVVEYLFDDGSFYDALMQGEEI